MGNEKRKAKNEKRTDGRSLCRFSLFVFRFSFAVVAAGCASDKHPTTRPGTAYERQEAALNDPFGYSPDMERESSDVSGGDLGNLDRKAMKKDVDHVLNP
jgi:hypothetical protein